MNKKYKLPQTASLRRAVQSYRKFLIKIGIDPDRKISKNNFRVFTPWYEKGVEKSAPLAHSVEQLICNHQVACSNRARGTKPIRNWRLEESKKFTIAPAYNKGAYQVISSNNVKDIGK